MHCIAEDATWLFTRGIYSTRMSNKKDPEKALKPISQDQAENIARKAKEAADSVRQLIMTIGMTIENKVALEDQINGLSDKTESMLLRIDNIAKVNQKNLLLAYKKFLEHNLEAVNHRLKEFQ